MKLNKLLILTEAGQGIGYGHFTRCSAILEHAIEKNLDCKMIVDWAGENIINELGINFPWVENLEKITSQFIEYNIILIDSYKLSEDGFKYLKLFFEKVIVIDDYNRITYIADILINPNVYFGEIDYYNQSAKCYGGEEFVILRKQFRTINKDNFILIGNKLLVTIGGSDTKNILPNICKALFSYKNFIVTVICPEKKLKNNLYNQFPSFIFKEYLTSDEMYNELNESDIVISGCGQTLHELASMDKKTIGIELGDDQKMNQIYYYNKGFLPNLIHYNDFNFFQKISDAFNIINNRNTNHTNFESKRTIITKNGINNILELIFSKKTL